MNNNYLTELEERCKIIEEKLMEDYVEYYINYLEESLLDYSLDSKFLIRRTKKLTNVIELLKVEQILLIIDKIERVKICLEFHNGILNDFLYELLIKLRKKIIN